MHSGYMLACVFFNVGQGNSVLIVLPPDEESGDERRYGLIDCYYNKTRHDEPPVLTYLKDHRVNRLEFVILTHADRDHFLGLSQVLDYFSRDGRSFKLFIESSIRCGDAAYNKYYFPELEGSRLTENETNEYYNELMDVHEMTHGKYVFFKKRRKHSPFQYRILKAYEEIQLTPDLKATTLSPCEDNITRVRKDIIDNYGFKNGRLRSKDLPKRIDCNMVSLAFKIEYGNSVLLICGDVLNPEWFRIIRDFRNCKQNFASDLINVSHHGSSGGNPKKLWRAIAKKNRSKGSVAIISCGYSSRHHHPSESTLNQIFANNVELYCINKGYPCRDFEVVRPLEIAAQRIRSSRPIQEAMLDLGAKEEICSGECIFGLDMNDDVKLIHREQEAFCAYKEYKFKP